jgi:hypothetical protein
MTAPYFIYPFASSGDLTAVPNTVQPDGSVSYPQGYGPYYAQDPATNPTTYKDIERNKMNQLFFDLTTAVQQYQQHGIPDFITSAMNGGTAYSYSIGDRVTYGGIIYVSISNANTDTPPSANWASGNQGAMTNVLGLSAATTLTHAMVSNSLVVLQSLTGATSFGLPVASTFLTGEIIQFWNTSAYTATLVRQGSDVINAALTSFAIGAGDTLTLTKSNSGAWLTSGGSATLIFSSLFTSTLATTGSQVLPNGLILKWGTSSGISPNNHVAVTFASAFPNACFGANWTPIGSGDSNVGGGGGVAKSTSGLTIYNWSPSITYSGVYWLAWGN